ncbi:hypothetical protein M409DRAFT_61383 [Zasmidium cellare ATCC 36951]|uniref:Uncharacterized protein n=1 Tax=Zasmidium cellare ATCC 36951 TaxID=1080233 RepID=A0A6A6BZ40_ZASCE|nr:uncharacterized protein M409DRAFT_61383 [Zasmidium cellare ATCC 36951]KAF2158799.1 hypothetical protein M409DRAFT_61383 [Zasmidium cellare ATCC 36951]
MLLKFACFPNTSSPPLPRQQQSQPTHRNIEASDSSSQHPPQSPTRRIPMANARHLTVAEIKCRTTHITRTEASLVVAFVIFTVTAAVILPLWLYDESGNTTKLLEVFLGRSRTHACVVLWPGLRPCQRGADIAGYRETSPSVMHPLYVENFIALPVSRAYAATKLTEYILPTPGQPDDADYWSISMIASLITGAVTIAVHFPSDRWNNVPVDRVTMAVEKFLHTVFIPTAVIILLIAYKKNHLSPFYCSLLAVYIMEAFCHATNSWLKITKKQADDSVRKLPEGANIDDIPLPEGGTTA